MACPQGRDMVAEVGGPPSKMGGPLCDVTRPLRRAEGVTAAERSGRLYQLSIVPLDWFLNFHWLLDWFVFVLPLQLPKSSGQNAWTPRTRELWRNLPFPPSKGTGMVRVWLPAPGSPQTSRWGKHVVYLLIHVKNHVLVVYVLIDGLMYLCSRGLWPPWSGCGLRVRPTTTSPTFLQGEGAVQWTPWPCPPWPPPQTLQPVSQTNFFYYCVGGNASINV